MSEWLDWIEDEVAPLLGGAIFNGVSEDDVEDVAAAFLMLDFVEKQCKKSRESLRKVLLAAAEKDGSPTEKGGNILFLESGKVIRERRMAKLPDEKALRALLKEKGLDPELVFTPVRKLELDPSKLQNAIDTGKLDEEAVVALLQVDYALKVSPASNMERLLLDARKPYLTETSAKKAPTKKAPAKKAPRKRKAKAAGPRKEVP